jgi:hypothetical protein
LETLIFGLSKDIGLELRVHVLDQLGLFALAGIICLLVGLALALQLFVVVVVQQREPMGKELEDLPILVLGRRFDGPANDADAGF